MASAYEQFEKELKNLVVRFYIESALKNYDEYETYIIYNGNEVAIYNRELLEVRKAKGDVDSYMISGPIMIV